MSALSGKIFLVTSHVNHPRKGSKQHAQFRDDPPRRRPLWVYDADDWRDMTSLPSGSLVCPVSTCRSPFAVPIQNSKGTRFLRDLPGSSCEHAWARPDLGGGPMSPQHRWLQARIARICDRVGHAAITEHYDTNADVYVADAKFVIEVQRWSTAFERRTLAREQKGNRVLWLLTEDAEGRSVNRALFSLPAARVRVHARGDRSRRLTPWLDEKANVDAVLSIYATVARLDRGSMTLKTGHHDGAQFFADILSGQRRWYPPGTPDLPRTDCGAWVKSEDLVLARAARSAALDKRGANLPTSNQTPLEVPSEGPTLLRESLTPSPSPMTLVGRPPIEPPPIQAEADHVNVQSIPGTEPSHSRAISDGQSARPPAPPMVAEYQAASALSPRRHWWHRLRRSRR